MAADLIGCPSSTLMLADKGVWEMCGAC